MCCIEVIEKAMDHSCLANALISISSSRKELVVKMESGMLDYVGALWVHIAEMLINQKKAGSILNVREARTKDSWFLYFSGYVVRFTEKDEFEDVILNVPRPKKAVIIAIGGPSASGKTTIGKRLVRAMKEEIACYPAYTTRLPREGEKDGVDYHFWFSEKLSEARKNPYFSDFIQARENWYWVNRWEIFKKILTQPNKVHLFFMTQRHEFLTRAKFFPWMDWIWLDAPEQEIVRRMKERGDSEGHIRESLKHNQKVGSVYIDDVVSLRIENSDRQFDSTLERIINFINQRKGELQ